MARPYEPLNLERNPFGGREPEERARIAVFDVDRRVEQMEAGKVVEFVGDHGRGKSMRLQRLAREFDDGEYHRIAPDATWSGPRTDGPLLVDEIVFMEEPRRRQLWASGRPIAVATHTTLADEIAEAGREVVTVDLDEPLDLERLAEMFRRHIEFERLEDGPVPTLDESALRYLRNRYGSDHRAMQDHLYEVFAAIDRPRSVGAEDLETVDPPDPDVIPPGSGDNP